MFDIAEYFLDYRYMEVQPDLLEFVLPKALEAWARHQLDISAPDHFKGDWHFEGMWEAFGARPLHPEFLDSQQNREVINFMVEILFELMRKEKNLHFRGQGASPYEWIQLLTTLIILFPVAQEVWERWWSYPSEAYALCGVQWLSSFMFENEDNPFFEPWTPSDGGGTPFPCATGLMSHSPSSPEDIAYLRTKLSKAWVLDALKRASKILEEHAQAGAIASAISEYEWRSLLVEERIMKFVSFLEREDTYMVISWDDC